MGLDAYLSTVDARVVRDIDQFEMPHNRRGLSFVVYEYIKKNHKRMLWERSGVSSMDDFEFLLTFDPELKASEETGHLSPYFNCYRPALNLAKGLMLYDPDFLYYRKNWSLHESIEALYRRNGGSGEFNCTEFKIDEENLNQLETDLMNTPLTVRGMDEFSYLAGTYAKLRKQINLGRIVYYWAWY